MNKTQILFKEQLGTSMSAFMKQGLPFVKKFPQYSRIYDVAPFQSFRLNKILINDASRRNMIIHEQKRI